MAARCFGVLLGVFLCGCVGESAPLAAAPLQPLPGVSPSPDPAAPPAEEVYAEARRLFEQRQALKSAADDF